MRPPALSDLNTSQLAWKKLEESTLEWLTPLLLKYPCKVAGAFASTHNHRPSYLRLSSLETGNHFAFVKLVSTSLADRERLIGNLGKEILHRGAATPVLLSVLSLPDNITAFIYEWVEGSPIGTSLKEMKLFGNALSNLHKTLAHVSGHFDIEFRTQKRLESLAQLASSPCFSTFWEDSTEREFVFRMRDVFLSDLKKMMSHASPCHGDINLGNILVRHDGTAVFIDLEDALHSAVWPGLDIAKAIERILLPRVSSSDIVQLESAIDALVQAYLTMDGQDLGSGFEPGNGHLARTMRWHTGLAIVVMTSNRHFGNSTIRCELTKFNEVIRLVDAYDYLL